MEQGILPIYDRIFEAIKRMKDIQQQLKFSSEKIDFVRISLLEEYSRDFAEILQLLCEMKNKNL
jgi:hypothetical protein